MESGMDNEVNSHIKVRPSCGSNDVKFTYFAQLLNMQKFQVAKDILLSIVDKLGQ